MQPLKTTAPDTALYLRLSREDGNASESESITSQRILLQQYAAANGFQIAAIYVDDGKSGMEWKRPAFQKMLQSISGGYIRTVLIKDLSRLSRDYIQTGELLERWFPAHNVRLIAVNDGVDTAREAAANDFSPLRAVLNDWYARDISRKVRAALSARQRMGICTLARAPFGYQKAGETLILASEPAKIVQTIYKLYQNGASCLQIANDLTSQNVLTPSENGTTWNDTTVRRILRNPVYAGTLRLHQAERFSYKCKRKRIIPIVESPILHVPAIISQETFHAVQAQMRARSHKRFPAHPLSGKIMCGDCGSSMVIQRSHSSERIMCNGRKRRNNCQNPSLSAQPLTNALTQCAEAHEIPYTVFCQICIDHITIQCEQIDVYLQIPISKNFVPQSIQHSIK